MNWNLLAPRRREGTDHWTKSSLSGSLSPKTDWGTPLRAHSRSKLGRPPGGVLDSVNGFITMLVLGGGKDLCLHAVGGRDAQLPVPVLRVACTAMAAGTRHSSLKQQPVRCCLAPVSEEVCNLLLALGVTA